MNDKINKYITTRTKVRLFPYLKDKKQAEKLQIDNESLHYITIREHAEKISSIIRKHLSKIKINVDNIIITDATACVGGNTISFAKNFSYVYSIEINKDVSKQLINNVNIYELKNVKIINDNCAEIVKHINKHDVIFIDPPWGGSSYKIHKNLKLTLGKYSLESLCNIMLDNKQMKCVPKLIVLKLPINYDIINFCKIVTSKQIYFHNLNKMFIIVIMNDIYYKLK